MRLLSRLFYADEWRKSRFHTMNGRLCLHPFDFGRAALERVRFLTGKRPPLPWLPRPVVRFLDQRIRGLTLFEFGSGTSTAWFARRCAKVVSVENDAEWHEMVLRDLAGLTNVELLFRHDEDAYARALSESWQPEVILIDGWVRAKCVHRNVDRLRAARLIVLDNSDAEPEAKAGLIHIFAPEKIKVLCGYAPAQMHPNETMIIEP
jgi:hypothetical protein